MEHPFVFWIFVLTCLAAPTFIAVLGIAAAWEHYRRRGVGRSQEYLPAEDTDHHSHNFSYHRARTRRQAHNYFRPSLRATLLTVPAYLRHRW